MTYIEKNKQVATKSLNKFCSYCTKRGPANCSDCPVSKVITEIKKIKPVQVTYNSKLQSITFI